MLKRIYGDYFMPNRYKEYENFLKTFIDNNFNFIRVRDYELLKNKDEKYFVLRHDIDSDVKIAKKMFEIEKKLGIYSTYYFRLCTQDKEFMQELIEYGSEVGYHYEEIAQYCKDNNNISPEFVNKNINEIKDIMIKNIKRFEDVNQLKISSIASHGDFINRRIDIINKYIYQEDMKIKLGLIEAYDIEKFIEFRTADAAYPIYWKKDPQKAIEEGKKKVLVLVHPRQWNSAPINRLKLDIQRLIEGIRYRK